MKVPIARRQSVRNILRKDPNGHVLYRDSDVLHDVVERLIGRPPTVAAASTKAELRDSLRRPGFNPDEAALTVAARLGPWLSVADLYQLRASPSRTVRGGLPLYLGMPLLVVGFARFRTTAGDRAATLAPVDKSGSFLLSQPPGRNVDVLLRDPSTIDKQVSVLRGRSLFCLGVLRSVSPRLTLMCGAILD